MTTNMDLIKVRVLAFGYQAFGLILTGVIGVLGSDAFQKLIMEHTGETVFGSLSLLVLSGIINHLRNLAVVKQYEQVGAATGQQPPVLI